MIIVTLVWALLTHSAAAEVPMVEWAVPAVPASQPQSDAEKEAGKREGRALPPLELLQPTLDPALPAYVPRRDIKLSGRFRGGASDVLPGLVKRWIAGFTRLYPNVTLTVDPPYAGSIGAKELVKENLDFVVVSRELKPDDITDFQAKFGYPPLSVAVSGGSYRHFGFLDAVAFFVNKTNPMDAISFAQLDALYSRTHLRGGPAATTWGDLGLTGAWAQKPVHLYGVKPWNGFEEFIRQRVLSTERGRGEWRDDITFSETVFAIPGQVAKDPNGIGYAGLAYLDSDVKVLAIVPDPGEPPLAPSYENVAAATYPLSRLIFFNTNKAPDKPLNPALAEFLRYILSREGQAMVREEAVYLPLRAWQADASRAKVGP